MNESLRKAASILWLAPERLGDALMGTAALELLKRHRPDLRVTVVAFSETAREVYRHNPHCAQLLCNPSRGRRRELSRTHDLLIHIHPDIDHEHLRGFSLPHSAPPDMNLHEHQAKVQLDFIGRQLGLADIPLLGYTLNYTAADLEAVRQQLRPAGESSKAFLIGCNMGCSRLARRGLKFWKPLTHPKVWATTHLLAFDSLLRARFAHARLVLIGAGSEAGIAKAFCKKSPHTISMAGRTTVSQLAALVDQLDGVISSDTGLLHVACARRKKLVALHGPSNPARTGPFPPHDAYHVIQRKTMDDITPGLVMQALIDYRWFS